MAMRTVWVLAGLTLGGGFLAASGCELIASVDRSLIESDAGLPDAAGVGGSGGASSSSSAEGGGGAGGAGGMTVSSSSAGGNGGTGGTGGSGGGECSTP